MPHSQINPPSLVVWYNPSRFDLGKVKCRARAKSGTNISCSRLGSGSHYFRQWPFGNVSHSVPQRSLGLEAPVCTEGKQWLGEPKDECVVWREGFSYVDIEPSQNRTPVPSLLSWSSPRSASQLLGSSLVLPLVGSSPQSSLTPQPLYPSACTLPTEFSGSLSPEHRSKLQE